MKYNIGDKVRIKDIDWYNKNKNSNGDVVVLHKVPHFSWCEKVRTVFTKDMVKFCGKVVTIESVWSVNYSIVEGTYRDGINIDYFTDEMIEGLVEEKIKPKFKVGDKIKLKSTLLNDIFGVIGYESEGYRITNISNGLTYFMSYSIEHYYELVEEETKNNNEMIEGLMEEKVFIKANDIYNEEYSKGEYCHEQSFKWGFQEGYNYSHENDKLEISLKEGYIFKDENGNEIHATKIVLEKKKNEYPKTYEECCAELNYLPFTDEIVGYKWDLMQILQQLFICRDAYWKIAGEEMDLGKPWEPDCNSGYFIPAIIYRSGSIQKVEVQYRNAILSFPTAEMRDAFYENFKEDIEKCKKLL